MTFPPNNSAPIASRQTIPAIDPAAYEQAEAAFRQFIREKTLAGVSFTLMDSEPYRGWADLGASHETIVRCWQDEAKQARQESERLAKEHIKSTIAALDELSEDAEAEVGIANHKSSDGTRAADTRDGSDWLPFPEMNHEKYPELPGFFVDQHDRLREPAKGKGRSGKILSVTRCWRKRPDDSNYLCWGYRVRPNGGKRRVLIPRYFVAIARIRAEQERRKDYRR